jgi:hypothetical protein
LAVNFVYGRWRLVAVQRADEPRRHYLNEGKRSKSLPGGTVPLGLPEALIRAVGRTGGTITSAGLILAGTFTVLAVAGNSSQSRQLGFTIAFAILLNTFFVRTLLVPSIAVLLGRANWWPSRLSRVQQLAALLEGEPVGGAECRNG